MLIVNLVEYWFQKIFSEYGLLDVKNKSLLAERFINLTQMISNLSCILFCYGFNCIIKGMYFFNQFEVR